MTLASALRRIRRREGAQRPVAFMEGGSPRLGIGVSQNGREGPESARPDPVRLQADRFGAAMNSGDEGSQLRELAILGAVMDGSPE